MSSETVLNYLKDAARAMGKAETNETLGKHDEAQTSYARAQLSATFALIYTVNEMGEQLEGIRKEIERTGKRNDVGMNVARITGLIADISAAVKNHIGTTDEQNTETEQNTGLKVA
jgi:NTP pyrophosphatase (non-canonical NTP hydrolase)